MSVGHRLSAWVMIAMLATLMALGWVSIALAQADGDGDGFDGDELGIPIVLGVALLAYVGWTVIRRRSRKSS
jgi:threonine/homoserine/homoserine lactone efflux protein